MGEYYQVLHCKFHLYARAQGRRPPPPDLGKCTVCGAVHTFHPVELFYIF